MKPFLVLLALIVAFLLPPSTYAARGGLSGRLAGGYRSYKGARAIDGDTFRHRGQRYRLRDYNALEIGHLVPAERLESSKGSWIRASTGIGPWDGTNMDGPSSRRIELIKARTD